MAAGRGEPRDQVRTGFSRRAADGWASFVSLLRDRVQADGKLRRDGATGPTRL